MLRGLVIDTNRQQLRVTAIARDVSVIQLKGLIASTVSSVRNAYWELVYGLQAIDVARGSLDLAQKLLEDNRARVEVGTLAPLDVAQSEAEVANRRGLVAQAEAAARTAEITLKRLIVNGTEDPLWHARITPVDRPDFRSAPLDVEGAVRTALANRTDLGHGAQDASRQRLAPAAAAQPEAAAARPHRCIRRQSASAARRPSAREPA